VPPGKSLDEIDASCLFLSLINIEASIEEIKRYTSFWYEMLKREKYTDTRMKI